MLPPLFLALLLVCVLVQASVTNTEVKRIIDASKHIVKVKTEIQYESTEGTLEEYVLALPETQAAALALISAKCNDKGDCPVIRAKRQETAGFVLFSIQFAASQKGKITLTSHFTHLLHPYPLEVTQGETQYVEYFDSHLWASPYPTTKQVLTVKCGSADVLSYSQNLDKASRVGSKLTYGPYNNIPAFGSQFGDVRIHFKNHAPFLTLTNVVKEIELSMWGRVSVEEVYDLSHTGAALKHGFSRLDYTNGRKVGASFNGFVASLPKEAENVYYRDIIGNVTTSSWLVTKSQNRLELQPRFPLFGGWKTQWYQGYTVPTASALRVSTQTQTQYTLQMPFSSPIEAATVDELTLKVILPEGATNIQWHVPFELDETSQTKRKTYLDSSLYGRPVLVLHKKNLVPLHNVPFTVTFDFQKAMMFHEPLLLVASFMFFFILCMIIFRLEWSLAKTSAPATKTKTE